MPEDITERLRLNADCDSHENNCYLRMCAVAEIVRLRAELAELEQLFELQRKRMAKATAAWREANPGNDLVSPDLGALLDWLLTEARRPAVTP